MPRSDRRARGRRSPGAVDGGRGRVLRRLGLRRLDGRDEGARRAGFATAFGVAELGRRGRDGDLFRDGLRWGLLHDDEELVRRDGLRTRSQARPRDEEQRADDPRVRGDRDREARSKTERAHRRTLLDALALRSRPSLAPALAGFPDRRVALAGVFDCLVIPDDRPCIAVDRLCVGDR
jgi:hypothetical protein